MTIQNHTPRKILVVDDDPRLRDLLRRYLSEQGFNVFVAEDGKEMTKLWQREHFDLLVLDIMLPGEDGLSICRRLRGGHDNTPIIMLTAKAEEIDRIVGLEMGADDYLVKPFNPRELLARVNAILRRRGSDEHPGAPSQDNESVEFGPYMLNLSTRTLTKNGETIPITTGEFSVLKVFARHPKIPLSRDKLMELARDASMRPLIAAWMYKYHACASSSSPTPPSRYLYKRSGAWLMYSSPMVVTNTLSFS